MEQHLRSAIRLENQRRLRSQPVVAQFRNRPYITVTQCNICHSHNITVISNFDRYGVPIRAAQCNRCGLIFLVDRYSPEGYTEFYVQDYRPLVSAYLGRSVRAGTIESEQQRYADTLINAFRGEILPKGGELLDVGGSTGVVGAAFRKQFDMIPTVLDPSLEELKVAEKMGLKTIHGLLESWTPPPDLKFDVVLCCRTIDHFIDLAGSLTKLRSLLKPDGILLIDIIDFGMIWAKKKMVESAIKIDHCYYLSSENAPAIFRKVGLEATFSEVTSSSERVTYLCRPCEPTDIPADLADWTRERLRTIQLSRYDVEEQAPEAISSYQRVRRSAYRFKNRILKRLR